MSFIILDLAEEFYLYVKFSTGCAEILFVEWPVHLKCSYKIVSDCLGFLLFDDSARQNVFKGRPICPTFCVIQLFVFQVKKCLIMEFQSNSELFTIENFLTFTDGVL